MTKTSDRFAGKCLADLPNKVAGVEREIGDGFGRCGLVKCKPECVQGKPLVGIRKCEA